MKLGTAAGEQRLGVCQIRYSQDTSHQSEDTVLPASRHSEEAKSPTGTACPHPVSQGIGHYSQQRRRQKGLLTSGQPLWSYGGDGLPHNLISPQCPSCRAAGAEGCLHCCLTRPLFTNTSMVYTHPSKHHEEAWLVKGQDCSRVDKTGSFYFLVDWDH